MPRDKFAAMASRAASDTESASGAEAEQKEQAPSATTPPTVTQPPRRDKFAAMASRSTTAAAAPAAPSGGRGNKFATMAAAAMPTVQEPKKDDETEAKEKRLKGIKEKLSNRKKILENLDRAEDLTCRLLEIAHHTTMALEDLTGAPNISELSRTYRETLRELHPLLSTDTEDLIQPYQNHSTETKQSMYAARVEMRLAKERTQVLNVITQLERNQQEAQRRGGASEGEGRKRPRE